MAKSLRSKSKRAFRRIKRDDPKSDFHLKDKIRVARLSDKLKVLTAVENSDDEEFEDAGNENGVVIEQDLLVNENTSEPTAQVQEQAHQDKSSEDQPAGADVEMDVRTASIGTGGARMNANAAWRKRNGVVATKKRTEKNSTTFAAKRRNFKSTGKAKLKGKR